MAYGSGHEEFDGGFTDDVLSGMADENDPGWQDYGIVGELGTISIEDIIAMTMANRVRKDPQFYQKQQRNLLSPRLPGINAGWESYPGPSFNILYDEMLYEDMLPVNTVKELQKQLFKEHGNLSKANRGKGKIAPTAGKLFGAGLDLLASSMMPGIGGLMKGAINWGADEFSSRTGNLVSGNISDLFESEFQSKQGFIDNATEHYENMGYSRKEAKERATEDYYDTELTPDIFESDTWFDDLMAELSKDDINTLEAYAKGYYG